MSAIATIPAFAVERVRTLADAWNARRARKGLETLPLVFGAPRREATVALAGFRPDGARFVRLDRLTLARCGATYSHRVAVPGRLLVDVRGPALVAPAAEGWRLIGTIEAVPCVQVREVPGETIPPRYRETPHACEHCKVQRARNGSIVLAHVDGRIMQVGSACVRDFLGDKYLENVLSYCELARGIADADAASGTAGMVYCDVQEFLAWVAMGVREHGFVSRASAESSGRESTAARAEKARYASLNRQGHEPPVPEPSAVDHAQASACLAWGRDECPTETSYGANVRELCRAGVARWNAKGLIASIPEARARHLGATLRAPRPAPRAPSEYLGAVGGKVAFEATLVHRSVHEGHYGPTTILRFEAGSNVVVWFASGYQLADEDIGKTYAVKASVKKLDTYRDVRQTIITRAKLAQKG